MKIPEVKRIVPESNEADDEQLRTLIDKYGVNGICRLMSAQIRDIGDNEDFHVASALSNISFALITAANQIESRTR